MYYSYSISYDSFPEKLSAVGNTIKILNIEPKFLTPEESACFLMLSNKLSVHLRLPRQFAILDVRISYLVKCLAYRVL